jgi:hypothetical protein
VATGQNPGASFGDVGKLVGQAWAGASADEKTVSERGGLPKALASSC